MIPILYPANTVTFDSNGLGMMADAISCRVNEEINGKFELAMTYPVTGCRFQDLDYRTIIMAKPSPGRAPQPFRVYRLTPSSAGTVKICARHLAYDLIGIPVVYLHAESCEAAIAGLKAAAEAEVDCPFDFETDIVSSAVLHSGTPVEIWRLLSGMDGSFLDTYGGEFEFDRWTVRLLKRRGADRGFAIRYGKNLTTLEQDKNCAEVYTGVLPFWINQDQTQAMLLSPAVVQVPGEFDFQRIKVLDLSEHWTELPDRDAFDAMVNQYIRANDIGKPKVGWKIQFAPTDQMGEFAHLDEVEMGDTCNVFFPALNVEATSRVRAAEYDVLADRYCSVTLGSVRDSLAKTVASQSAQIACRPTFQAVKTAAYQISNEVVTSFL